jgi:chemotaxis protein histidine kinase CheA
LEDLEEIIAEFLVESHENLDQLDSDLVALEQDPTSRQLLGAIFRTIHTIQGDHRLPRVWSPRGGHPCRGEPAEQAT